MAKIDYQKPNPPNWNTIKENHKCLSDRNAFTTTSEANWFLLATTKPPMPQSIQTEAEVMDQNKIFASMQPNS